jgi:hypothetical protein
MKSDKMGISVKKNSKGLSSALFGAITKFEQVWSKLHNEVKITEGAVFDKQVERTLLEAETQKSQAIELLRGLQNC